MEKRRNHLTDSLSVKKTLLPLILVFSVLFLGAIIYGFLIYHRSIVFQKKTDKLADNKIKEKYPFKKQLPEINTQKLTVEYINNINAIIASYKVFRKGKESDQLAKFIRKTKSNLLEMVVPADYKNFHLALVLALNAVDKKIGPEFDKSGVNNKKEDLEKKLQELDSIVLQWESLTTEKGG